MANAQTSFDRAENACVVFLADVLGIPAGNNDDITRDDWIEPQLVNKVAFCLSGGPEQTQNFCVPGRGAIWYAFGNLLAQYEKRSEAILALGKIQERFPARRNGGTPGLVPNVRNFEMLEHPEIFSVIVQSEDGQILGRNFTLRARFRVVYDNTDD